MRLLVLSVLLMARPFSASAWQGNPTLELEIEEAVRRAVSVSPRIVTAEGAILSARGQRAQAFWPFSGNPTVEFERTRRLTAPNQVFDHGWRLGQQIEIAGQSFLRTGAANRRIQGGFKRSLQRLDREELRWKWANVDGRIVRYVRGCVHQVARR